MPRPVLKAACVAACLSFMLATGTAVAADPAPAKPEKVYIIINITYKPTRYAQTLDIIRKFAAYEAKHGVELAASYSVVIGQGNRMVNIWAADSLDAWQKTVDGYMGVVDMDEAYASIDREDLEVAVANPIVAPKLVPNR